MMAKLEAWKIRRELIRLGRNLAALPVEVVRMIYFRRWYDHVTARAIRRTHGRIPLKDEIGIYLIFPSDGIVASHLCVLDEMHRNDIAPVVISNLPLSDDDRNRLSERAMLVMAYYNTERPHSTHGILTPDEAYASKTEPMRLAA